MAHDGLFTANRRSASFTRFDREGEEKGGAANDE
jgi:hypothetical protein